MVGACNTSSCVVACNEQVDGKPTQAKANAWTTEQRLLVRVTAHSMIDVKTATPLRTCNWTSGSLVPLLVQHVHNGSLLVHIPPCILDRLVKLHDLCMAVKVTMMGMAVFELWQTQHSPNPYKVNAAIAQPSQQTVYFVRLVDRAV